MIIFQNSFIFKIVMKNTNLFNTGTGKNFSVCPCFFISIYFTWWNDFWRLNIFGRKFRFWRLLCDYAKYKTIIKIIQLRQHFA